MSKQMGWKQFQPEDDLGSEDADATAAEDAPAPVGTGVPLTATQTPQPGAAAPSPAPAAPHVSRRASPSGGTNRFRLGELIWLCLVVVDAFLALDFLLKAVDARGSTFVQVVTGVGDRLASPFTGVFIGHPVPHAAHTTYWQALVAIVVYTIVTWIVIRVLRLLAAPSAPRGPRG
ncbi:MAG: hypothetical protein ACREOL_06910 [Candidatus Dormibacteria bacterium]